MKIKNYSAGLVIAFLATVGIGQDDLQKKYVGQSKCTLELQSAAGSYGIRLDKSQRAYLAAYKLAQRNVLTIVQYKDDNDRCGVVRDVVRSHDADSSFVWECLERSAPSDVVVGTWPVKHPEVSGQAIEAWRIDMKRLRFVPTRRKVTCKAANYAGSDDGGDLASWAKKRSPERPAPKTK